MFKCVIADEKKANVNVNNINAVSSNQTTTLSAINNSMNSNKHQYKAFEDMRDHRIISSPPTTLCMQ